MQIHDKHFDPFLSQEVIRQAVTTIATSITDDYRGCDLVCIVVLKGSFIFAADLVRAIDVPCRVEFLSAKSYGSSMTSSGDVVIELPNLDITGKHVLLIEDIVDTGLTISALQSALWKFHPASLEVAALISKPAMRKVNLSDKGRRVRTLIIFEATGLYFPLSPCRRGKTRAKRVAGRSYKNCRLSPA